MPLGKFRKMLIEQKDWEELATFVPNKKLPVYNWFYYKEGFAADLVFKLIEKFAVRKDTVVLDPFCGSGTTLLACKHLGLQSIGYDVLPVSVFASYVKTRNYYTDKLRLAGHELFKAKFQKYRVDAPPIMYRAFSKYALDDIIFFKRRISEIEDEDIRYFFLLGLVKAALAVSYAWKDGAVIKIKKKHSPPLRLMLNRTLKKMIKDLEKFKAQRAGVVVEQCDARIMNTGDESVDCIITSPPYLNQIDYTKVYAIENFIISSTRLAAQPAVRSYIGLKGEYDYLISDVELPLSAKAYFTDMNAVLEEMYRVCKHGADVAIVVGNGFVEGQIVDSDLILAHMAEKCGFDVKSIFVLNERYALVNRTEKKGILRESLIILKKN
jgi:DNA modification methylase